MQRKVPKMALNQREGEPQTQDEIMKVPNKSERLEIIKEKDRVSEKASGKIPTSESGILSKNACFPESVFAAMWMFIQSLTASLQLNPAHTERSNRPLVHRGPVLPTGGVKRESHSWRRRAAQWLILQSAQWRCCKKEFSDFMKEAVQSVTMWKPGAGSRSSVRPAAVTAVCCLLVTGMLVLSVGHPGSGDPVEPGAAATNGKVFSAYFRKLTRERRAISPPPRRSTPPGPVEPLTPEDLFIATFVFTDGEDEELRKRMGDHLINTNCSAAHNRQALSCKMALEYDTFSSTLPRIGGLAGIKRPADGPSDGPSGEPSGKKNQPVVAKVFPSSKLARENSPPPSANITRPSSSPRQTRNTTKVETPKKDPEPVRGRRRLKADPSILADLQIPKDPSPVRTRTPERPASKPRTSENSESPLDWRSKLKPVSKPAAPSQPSKPLANGAGKPQTSDSSPSSHLSTTSISTFVFTDGEDEELRKRMGDHLINTNCSAAHNRQALSCKMALEYDTFINSAKKWFCHVDDDNYVNVGSLLKLLSQFSHSQDVYLGRPSLERPIEATEKLGTAEMFLVRHRRSRILSEPRPRSQDETLGEALLGVRLLRSALFHSHLENLGLVTLSYGTVENSRNTVNVNGLFSLNEDPTRFRSVHCLLYPDTAWCPRPRDTLTAGGGQINIWCNSICHSRRRKSLQTSRNSERSLTAALLWLTREEESLTQRENIPLDRGLGSGGGVGPAARVQLVVGDGASVLVGSVGGQVLCSHTRGVLKTGRTGRRGGVEEGWWGTQGNMSGEKTTTGKKGGGGGGGGKGEEDPRETTECTSCITERSMKLKSKNIREKGDNMAGLGKTIFRHKMVKNGRLIPRYPPSFAEARSISKSGQGERREGRNRRRKWGTEKKNNLTQNWSSKSTARQRKMRDKYKHRNRQSARLAVLTVKKEIKENLQRKWCKDRQEDVQRTAQEAKTLKE
ncbi:hypothetical protein F7725_005937 [Dissostichus mawsoni]|uniref:Fringe-like glycosyltransferase domain-containing protein n=1 Tax=Dissostichus mawsoni TaxID=36200 RepID=A0A7J5YSN4_DISMA|nr:hypothetical protein F7725_005937 [Dissostichus mawsoni]